MTYKPWQFHSVYRGVQIEWRDGMRKRGWRIHTTVELGSSKPGVQVFDSLEAAQRNVDRRIERSRYQ